MRSTFFGTVFLVVSSVFFLIGGLGYRTVIVQDFGIFAGILLVSLAWIMNGAKFATPKYLWIYGIFTVVVGLDVITRGVSFDSPKFFSLILAGTLFCLSFYMATVSKYGEEILQKINYYLLSLGWVFFLGSQWLKNAAIDKSKFTFGLLQPLNFEHSHLGVYWAILIVGLILLRTKEKFYAWYRVMSMGLGIYLVIASQARSAYILILLGMISYFKNKIFIKKNRLIVLLTTIFVLVGVGVITVNKPIRLFNFYIPAVYALKQFPLGTGMGNFREVSAYYSYLFGTVDYVSTLTHNLFFEMTIGLGFLGFIYWIWYFLNLKEYFYSKQLLGENYFMSMYVGISVLFMVDPGYVVPVLYWLWMAFLGMGLGRMNQGAKRDLQT